MVNWKKLFEEDYDEVEESSKSKKKKRSKLFEEEVVEGYDDEEEYYAALEAELNSSKPKNSVSEKISRISNLKSVNKFEEDELEDYYEEDDYQAALEEELKEAAERTEKSRSFFSKKEEDVYEEDEFTDVDELELEETQENKKSRFSFFKKKAEKEDLSEEEIFEDDLYDDFDLEEKKEKKSGFSFFKKKEVKEDEFEDEIFEDDLEEEFELEEKKEKKSGFSFFKKKAEKEDLYEDEIFDEEDEYADLERELGLREEKKATKSGFSFFKKKESKEEVYEESEDDLYDDLDLEETKKEESNFSFFKKKETKEELYEDDSYEEYDEETFTDVEEDIYDDLELEETQEKESRFSFFKKKENKEEVYEESEDDLYDDLDLEETKEEKSKKSRFSFASLKERFTGNDKDEYDYEQEESEDLEVDKEEIYEEVEEELVVEKEPVKKESCLNKVTALFKTKDKSAGSEYDYEEESEDDEAEDYKTYLERQKQEAKQKQDEYDDFDLEVEYVEEDLELEKDLAPRPSGKEFFASVKDKFSNKFNKSEKEEELDYDQDEELDYDYDYEEEVQEEKPAKKEGFFGRFINKSDKSEDEEYEIEYVEEEPSIADKLDLVEEKEIDPEEEENISLQESLRSFGIEADQIKSVDVFEERSPKEERERRVHPTLASVKVRRILQEKEIDEIAYDLSLSNGKDRFAKSIAKESEEQVEEVVVENIHESKNQEEIDRLNNDFNRLDRKQDKISNSENFLRDRDSDKIESVMENIKSTQEEISRDTRDYTIEVEESDGAPVRRSKLSYTSLDDVLSGNEDVLATDIERKKFDVNTSDEPHPEEIENLRKGLFKDKTSQDLVSSRERSNLDNLILETNIVEKSNEKKLEEITMLEENLELIKEDKVRERVSRDLEDDLSIGFEEEISIEKVAKESEYKFESYEDLRHADEYAEDEYYSDYDLDEEEIYELETQNEIEYKSDQVDIEALNRELKQKKIDEYRSQYWGVKNNSVEEKATTSPASEAISSTSTTASYDYARQESMAKKFQAEKPRGIEYEEKLYTNDVDEYFVTEDAPLTFGEYKTQDRGYRPVSRTTIEEKQKKLDAIFDKYSNVKIPRKNTTEYVQQKITSPVRVDKYKPTQVVSAIYGTSRPAPAEATKVAKDVKAAASAISTPKAKAAKNNYFQEIASKEEQSWNLDLAPRVQKNKKSKKK
ncbi:MAG: hypothetical protein Q3988_06295 [Gemella sp.]|nr:hypothetical protein [Gemella sp.]